MKPEIGECDNIINGVLLEGVDFVGKTTAALSLFRQLDADGIRCKVNKCYANRCELIEFLEGQAGLSDSMLQRDWFYSAAILVDLFLLEKQELFIVQDRHWLTQAGRNGFFAQETDIVEPKLLEEKHVPFKYNVLLTSSLEAKLERSKKRPPSSPRDRFLAQRPQLHQEYEEYLRTLIPDNENWFVLDTTDLAVDTVTKVIRDYVGL